MTLAYLATTRTGQSYVVSVFAQNRSQPIDPAVAGPVMCAAIKGAFTLQRYLMYFGPADGGSAAAMFEDLADLFEQAAADGTPVRAIVGEDPVEFAEAFLRNYPGGQWINRERERLTNAIDRVAGNES